MRCAHTTKTELLISLGKDVDDILANWPPSIPSPRPSQEHADFWNNLASTAPPSPDPTPVAVQPYPSVLLKVDSFQNVSDLVRELSKEITEIKMMDAQEFASSRQNMELTFASLTKHPVPSNMPDESFKNAVIGYLATQLHELQTHTHHMPTPVTASRLVHNISDHEVTRTNTGLSQSIGPITAGSRPASSSTNARINSLAHNFSSLVDHLHHAGVGGLTSMTSPQQQLPSYIAKTLHRPNSALNVVPDHIPDYEAQEDLTAMKRLQWLHSPLNITQNLIHEDIERFIQNRFCAQDMTTLNLERKVSARRRYDILRQKRAISQDVRRYLEIRQQRYMLQKRKLGDALAKAEVEDLKSFQIT